LGQVLIAKFFCVIFAKGYTGGGVPEGIRFGILMGFFSMGHCVINYAVMPVSCSLGCYWMGLGFLQMLGAGVVASLVYKK
jgi:hypothetical protein